MFFRQGERTDWANIQLVSDPSGDGYSRPMLDVALSVSFFEGFGKGSYIFPTLLLESLVVQRDKSFASQNNVREMRRFNWDRAAVAEEEETNLLLLAIG